MQRSHHRGRRRRRTVGGDLTARADCRAGSSRPVRRTTAMPTWRTTPGFRRESTPGSCSNSCGTGASRRCLVHRRRSRTGDGNAEGFEVTCTDGESYDATYLIAASWSDPSYLERLDLSLIDRGSKRLLAELGPCLLWRGLFGNDVVAEQHHQTTSPRPRRTGTGSRCWRTPTQTWCGRWRRR